jgi:hypothetical protein
MERRFRPYWVMERRFRPYWVMERRFRPYWVMERRFRPYWDMERRFRPYWDMERRFRPYWVMERRFRPYWDMERRFRPYWDMERRFQPYWVFLHEILKQPIIYIDPQIYFPLMIYIFHVFLISNLVLFTFLPCEWNIDNEFYFLYIKSVNYIVFMYRLNSMSLVKYPIKDKR